MVSLFIMLCVGITTSLEIAIGLLASLPRCSELNSVRRLGVAVLKGCRIYVSLVMHFWEDSFLGMGCLCVLLWSQEM